MIQRDRKTYIGSADIAAVVGICDYRTPLDVYNAKVLGDTIEENERMRWGTLLEPVIVKEFLRQLDIHLYQSQISAQHPNYEFLAGTADALTDEFVIEVKTTHAYNKAFDDLIPNNYFVQCQWLMGLHNRQICYVPVLKGGQTLMKYTVDFNPNLYKVLVDSAVKFWHEHVIPQISPHANIKDDVFHKHTEGKSIEISPEKLQLLNEYYELKKSSEDKSNQLTLLKGLLFSDVGDVQTLTYDGKPVARRTERTRESWDNSKILSLIPTDQLSDCRKITKYYEVRIL